MMPWIVGSSLTFRFLVLAIAAALLVFGTEQLRKMRATSQDAGRRIPRVRATQGGDPAQGPGMTAAEVEELITIPMEQSLRGVPGLDIIRSKSARALSQVVLLFKPGNDIIEARQNVQELMNVVIAVLAQSSGMPIMLQPLSSTSRVMKIGITSKTGVGRFN